MIYWLIVIESIFCSILATDKVNILLNKPVVMNEDHENAKKVNDGDKKYSCVNLYNKNVNWMVFDLQDVYNIETIILWIGNYRSKQTISVYVGNKFMPCMFHNQINNFTACQVGVNQDKEQIELKCGGSGIVGQYLAIVGGSFFSDKSIEKLSICEIESYGKIITGKVARKRPEIQSEYISPISIDTFNLTKEIRKDVPSVVIPMYSTSLYFVNKNCQPIIWEVKTSAIFGAACRSPDSKARFTMFGKNDFFQQTMKNDKMSKLKANLLKWLSPKSNKPNIIDSNNIKSIADLKKLIKSGDIVDFNVWNPLAKDILQELKSMLLNGSVAMTMDHTFWVDTSIEARNSYLEILNIFNVDFSPDIINWNEDLELKLSDQDYNENILGIDQNIERMSKNHDNLLKMGKSVAGKVVNMQKYLLKRSKAGPFLKVMISKYNELLKWICPCIANPTIDKNDRLLVETLSNLFNNQLLINSQYKLPCIDLFPGDFATAPPRKTVKLTIESETSDTSNPIGYYLEAGQTLNYKVDKMQGRWSITIGCHTDVLNDNRPDWYRYPHVIVSNVKLENKGNIYSPYGGVISIVNEKKDQSITISLSNVVATPFFNARDPSVITQWNQQKNNVGLWAQLAGDNINFCVESKLIRSFNGTYLNNLLRNEWDYLVRMDLAFKSIDWKVKRPEIVVLDIMTSAGYGHSGYPIVAFLDWYDNLFDQNMINAVGNWGLCHEVGHNMQEGSWTFDGAGEVTNNLFCLYNYDKLWKLPYYGSEKLKLFRDYDRTKEVKEYLDNGAKFETWKHEPFTALLIYAQMANNFGWGFYNKVFKFYENNKMELNSDADKMSMWMNITSNIVGQNLIPMFEFWGFPIESKITNLLGKLPCLFPDDFYRGISDIRTKFIMNKYKSCDGKSKFFMDFSIEHINEERRKNFISVLNN